jgi:hypothetical protein
MSTQAQMQAFTRQAVAYAEQGRLAWTDIAALFARSFAQACTA